MEHPLSFDHTENAFAYKSDAELKKAKFLFKSMGNALLGMLDVLDASWGRWSYNTEKQKTIFQDDAALDKFIGYREEMEAATKEQKRLQAQFVSQASL